MHGILCRNPGIALHRSGIRMGRLPLTGQESAIDSADHLTAVARMYYLDGMAQSEIADLYQISRSTISRMLTSAREQGIVRISVNAFEPRDRELESALIDMFGLRRAIVVREVPGSITATRRALAHFAAPEVSTWFTPGKRVGVTGGRSLGELVRAIPYQSDLAGIGIYQMMGAVATTPNVNEPQEVTRALGKRLNGKVHMLHVPAFASDADARASMAQQDQVQAMWRTFSKLHQAMVGVGSIVDSMFVEHSVLNRRSQKELRKQDAVAELCGRFMNADGEEVDHPLRTRVLSIELDVLRTISDVIAVTSGSDRGPAAHAVLANGLAKSVVLDSGCAEAVLAYQESLRRSGGANVRNQSGD